MRFHVQQAVRAVILLGFAGLIVYLHYSGDIVKLINPKYEKSERSFFSFCSPSN